MRPTSTIGACRLLRWDAVLATCLCRRRQGAQSSGFGVLAGTLGSSGRCPMAGCPQEMHLRARNRSSTSPPERRCLERFPIRRSARPRGPRTRGKNWNRSGPIGLHHRGRMPGRDGGGPQRGVHSQSNRRRDRSRARASTSAGTWSTAGSSHSPEVPMHALDHGSSGGSASTSFMDLSRTPPTSSATGTLSASQSTSRTDRVTAGTRTRRGLPSPGRARPRRTTGTRGRRRGDRRRSRTSWCRDRNDGTRRTRSRRASAVPR